MKTLPELKALLKRTKQDRQLLFKPLGVAEVPDLDSKVYFFNSEIKRLERKIKEKQA